MKHTRFATKYIIRHCRVFIFKVKDYRLKSVSRTKECNQGPKAGQILHGKAISELCSVTEVQYMVSHNFTCSPT